MKRKESFADTIATLALAGRIPEDLASILIELDNRISKLEDKKIRNGKDEYRDNM